MSSAGGVVRSAGGVVSSAARWSELIGGPFRSSWRAGVAWAIGFVLLVVSTVAFWPAFKGSSALSTGLDEALQVLPQSMLDAFGLQDLVSPAGYLRGGLYEVIVPLMFAAAGVMFANSATAADEDAGRLELFVTQPVSRRGFMTARSLAILGWLVVLTLVVVVSQLASDAVYELEISTARVTSTIVLCALLGGLHAGLAFAVAGISARPGLVLAIGLVAALVGYLVAALFPMSDVLAPWRQVSPWDWALGGDPLVNETEPWRYAALAVPAGALAIIGIVAFDRRDVRSA